MTTTHAAGTCTIKAKTPQLIFNYFDLFNHVQEFIWNPTTLYFPDDYENAYIKTEEDNYQLTFEFEGSIHGNYYKYAKDIFTEVLNKDFSDPNIIECRDKVMKNGVELSLDFDQFEKFKDNTHHTMIINITPTKNTNSNY